MDHFYTRKEIQRILKISSSSLSRYSKSDRRFARNKICIGSRTLYSEDLIKELLAKPDATDNFGMEVQNAGA